MQWLRVNISVADCLGSFLKMEPEGNAKEPEENLDFPMS